MTPSAVRDLALWLCADLTARSLCDVDARVRAVIERVPACVWVRAPRTMDSRILCDFVGNLRIFSSAHGSALLVGDRVDVALATSANGVHLSETSVSPSDARLLLGPTAFVSRAVHHAFDIDTDARSVDALVLSPFRSVPGKAPALDVAGFAVLAARAPSAHWVALGGILTDDDARDAARSGARAIAVRRALLDAPDPARACESLRSAFLSA